MTLAEIRRQSNIIIEALTSGQTLPGPVLNRYINRGYRMMNDAAVFNLAPLALSTVSGTRTVAVPADFMYTRDVLYNGKVVTPVPYEWLDLVTTTPGIPVRYDVRNGNFYLDPIPSTTGATITGWYYATVADLSAAGDEPVTTLPARYHDYLIDYAVAEGLMATGRAEAAQVYMQRYNTGVKAASAAFRKDQTRSDISIFRARGTGQAAE